VEVIGGVAEAGRDRQVSAGGRVMQHGAVLIEEPAFQKIEGHLVYGFRISYPGHASPNPTAL